MAAIWFHQGCSKDDLSAVAEEGLRRIAARIGRDIYVVSTGGGLHQIDSLHYTGMAFDIWPNYAGTRIAASSIRQVLGTDWDIVENTEKGYIHCEYDPKN